MEIISLNVIKEALAKGVNFSVIMKILEDEGYDKRTILSTNLEDLVSKIESKFNTKVIVHKVIQKDENIFRQHLPFGVIIPFKTEFMEFLSLAIDSEDNVITHDYYEKTADLGDIDMSNPLDTFKATKYFSSLQTYTQVVYFMDSVLLNDLKVYHLGTYKVNYKNREDTNLIKDIDKIDDVRLCNLAYFIDNQLQSL